MFDKNLYQALRFHNNPPAQFDRFIKTTPGNPVHYRLRSLPVYFSGLDPKILRIEQHPAT